MKDPKKSTRKPAPRTERISIDKLQPEQARGNFKALLLANPNFFGNLKKSPFKPVLNVLADTAYEEIACVGFQPQFNRLEAVVYINRDSGYGGNICSSGSQEYVRFYLSFDNGSTWQDQGLSSFSAHDIPGDKPLEYDVTLQINPARYFCFFENLPKVRAILSWNSLWDAQVATASAVGTLCRGGSRKEHPPRLSQVMRGGEHG